MIITAPLCLCFTLKLKQSCGKNQIHFMRIVILKSDCCQILPHKLAFSLCKKNMKGMIIRGKMLKNRTKK